MRVRLIAVGDKQPSWVDNAVAAYTERLPRHWKFRLDAIDTAPRAKGGDATAAMQAEERKVLAAVKPSEHVVLLDERGADPTSRDLADLLNGWLSAGRDLCFVIGGPDGVSDECAARANYRWSLSRMTFPHGLARVMFTEQLYRAWTLIQGHPYHRD